jgi:hypothetical protein
MARTSIPASCSSFVRARKTGKFDGLALALECDEGEKAFEEKVRCAVRTPRPPVEERVAGDGKP